MGEIDDYPGAKSYEDRHGKTRWRYRAPGRYIPLPEQPGHPRFEAAYDAAVQGRKPPPAAAKVVKLPTAAHPRSMRAAWKLHTTTAPEWQEHEPETRARQVALAEEFLASKVVEDGPSTWGEMAIADLERRHVKLILSRNSSTPHKARQILTLIRKMVVAALDEEWTDRDPTYKIKWRPTYKGWRAWTENERALFEKRWAIGTTPRLVYAIAIWLGNRRKDIALLRLDQRFTVRDENGAVAIDPETGDPIMDEFRFRQSKTKRDLVLPVTPMLREVLENTNLPGPTVVVTAYGKPFSSKSLTGRMADWTKSAKLPPGCVLHGLRKTLGKMLASGGATTRQIMDSLGHTDIKHAELYTKEAEQTKLARDGMAAVVQFLKPRKGHG